VIRSLEVRDLVVIERAELAPPPGLTAVTGETGAGKTVLAQALGLLAGAPADPSAVRPGARHALVQATLAVPDGFWERLDEDDPALALRDLADDPSEIVLARRVPAEGRARALIDGQAARATRSPPSPGRSCASRPSTSTGASSARRASSRCSTASPGRRRSRRPSASPCCGGA
jgi:DNA repair ATPase RecN